MKWRYEITLTMGKSCRRSCDYVRLVVLRDPFLVVVFFEAAFFATVFFDAAFRVADFALIAWCLGEIGLTAPFGSVVVSNS